MSASRGALITVAVVLLIVGVGVGFLIGYFSRSTSAQETLMDKLTADANPTMKSKLMDEISPGNIREYLR